VEIVREQNVEGLHINFELEAACDTVRRKEVCGEMHKVGFRGKKNS
jgi:hypothetical protein